jgi:hypothetical protein
MTDHDDPTTDDTSTPDPLAAARAEAATYRRKLRDAEAQLEALRARVDGIARSEVEALAADTLRSPADLWLTGTELADLLADDGNPDPDKVRTAVEAVLSERPHWAKATDTPKAPPTRKPVPDLRGGTDPTRPVDDGPSWSQVIGAR